MDGDNFYLYLSSLDSKQLYPSNASNRFIINLPKALKISGLWEVCLTEVIYFQDFTTQKKPQFLLIHSDICEESVINGVKLPILQRCFIPEINNKFVQEVFTHTHYVKMRKQELDRIEIYITSETGESVSFKKDFLWCTLHLKKRT